MADQPLPLDWTLPLDAAARHDQICDRFEEILRSGGADRIADLLPQVPEAERRALFRALVRVALECRDPPPKLDEYRDRFPEFASLLEVLFHDPHGATLPAVALSLPGPLIVP